VLVVDAFSSDSIPVHLLTSQAMDVYFHHLRADGTLAFHISNRYLDLQPVLRGEAQASGRTARLVKTPGDSLHDIFSASWVLVASPAPGFSEEIETASTDLNGTRAVRLWTDNYSNLYQILR
jgi:hypothetical protein